MYNKFSKSQRGAPSNDKVQKAAPKKAAPAPVKKASKAPAKTSTKSPTKSAGKSKMGSIFPSSMSVPGSARPSSAKASIPPTGRDRFGGKSKAAGYKAATMYPSSRQEDEAKVMSAMRRDRLGPGQR